MTRILAALLLAASTAVLPAKDLHVHTWKKIQATDIFYSEGATYGDFNKDGKGDIAAGSYWYEGPDFKTKHEFAPVIAVDPVSYSKNFLAYTYDFNNDKWPDILIYGFPGEDASWYENPKNKKEAGHWTRHKIFDVVDNESPTFVDMTGDGKPELVCNSQGTFGFATADWKDASKPWKWNAISPKGPWQKFTHGIGAGDVNGDGKMDILEAAGWWEQPASWDGKTPWKKHNVTFGTGGAQMFAYDVDGDKDNDVITSLAAHGYGLAWYENIQEGEAITFKEHIFMNKEPEENKYGVKFSQLHALDLVDMDRDGIKDIVTGKRWWAHGPKGDAEPNAAAVVYWFKTVRPEKKGDPVDFIPYLIDDNSGVGTQVMAGDINGDKWPDVVVGNKKGTFVHLQSAKKVNEATWKKAQPQPLAGDRSSAK